MMSKADVIELDMSIDDALKYIISMGVVAPGSKSASGRLGNHAPQANTVNRQE